ncbi:hypothetical protein H0I39_04655 [Ottowia beijingensis]|uniref:Uncharacterized protein n=1 Tax=Ottowia beijingensis TaxID=1207057 RepID=A0A853IQU3_9BURK|nr:hypothetical protein [Ottowia beijingensis]NZA01235.1 hypothetical protein [Ottowia beijingensis]
MDDDIGLGELLIDNLLGLIGALILIWAFLFVCVGLHRVITGSQDEHHAD